MCLLANTREGHPHKNKSLICVPMKSRGITVNKIDKMGNHSSDTAQVFFEDVVVPRTHIIGEEGMGFVYQMKQFQQERMWGTASGGCGYFCERSTLEFDQFIFPSLLPVPFSAAATHEVDS